MEQINPARKHSYVCMLGISKLLTYSVIHLIPIYDSIQYSMDCNTVIIYILKMHEYMHNKIGMHRQKKTA